MNELFKASMVTAALRNTGASVFMLVFNQNKCNHFVKVHIRFWISLHCIAFSLLATNIGGPLLVNQYSICILFS